MSKVTKAGSSLRKLAQRRRSKALLRFSSAGGLAIVPFLITSLIGAAGVKMLVFTVCLGSAFVLARSGLKLWKQANNAKRGAKGEEIVATSLRQLEIEGWQVEYNIPVLIWGDVDVFVCSPSRNYFIIDTKSHSGTVFFNGTKLIRRYGQQIYEFDNNKDLLKAARGQAVEIKKMKGIRYVTPIICFTQAELDIRTVDNLIARVYVVKRESLVRLLRKLNI